MPDVEIIDAHAHLGAYKGKKECVSALLEGMARRNISLSLVSNAGCSEFPSGGNASPKPLSALRGLKECLELQMDYPGKFKSLLWIRPNLENRRKALFDFVFSHRNEIAGLKFHPYFSRLPITSEKLEPYLELAEELSLPVLVHTAADQYSRFGLLCECAKNHPGIIFVGAHLELYGDGYRAIEMMEGADNIYADTAWVNFQVAERLIDRLGPARLLFGTDAPIDGPLTTSNALYGCYYENRFGLNDEDYALLMGGNAKRIYSL